MNIYESGERKKKLRFTGLGGFSCYSGLSKSQPSALCAVAILEGIRQLLVDVKVGWPACLQEGSKILCCIITYRNCAYFINTGFWWDPEQEWRCLKAPLFKGMCVCWPLKWRTGEVVGYFRRAMGQGVDISRCPIPQCHWRAAGLERSCVSSLPWLLRLQLFLPPAGLPSWPGPAPPTPGHCWPRSRRVLLMPHVNTSGNRESRFCWQQWDVPVWRQ